MLKASVYHLHERLSAFPPAQGIYILYRRLVEQGGHATWLWLKDKIVRRTQGYSIPKTSRVAPHLYVGGQHKQHGLTKMREIGITAVVNMREESDDAAREVLLDHYLWLPTTDDAAPTLADLEEGVAFIRRHIEAGEGVYVHCASGVGRAPTMAAAYLVREGATPEIAWRQIRRARPFIRPTPPQIDVIETLARQDIIPPTTQAEERAVRDASPGKAAETSGATEASNVTEPAAPTTSPSDALASFSAGQQPANHHNNDEDETIPRRKQMASERIVGDPMLTSALTDNAAKILLDWADEEVGRLVAATASMDETAAWDYLDPKLSLLRRHVRRIAQQSAKATRPADQVQALLTRPDYG